MPEHHHKSSSPNDVTTLFEWESAGRPFKKRGKQFYLTAILIVLFVEVILFLFSQYLLMGVVIALLFVSFALAYVPPKNFYYKISTEGIMIEDRFFLWKELYDFYFSKSENLETLHVRTEAFIPGEIILTFHEPDKEKIKESLLVYLPFREYIKPTFMDKAAGWLTRNFPLENK
jgi:hypothetical protein